MDRSERISLRLSIAMHVALVLALEPSQQGHPEDRAPEPQMAQVQQIDLQVLKTQFARQEGTIPDRRDNDAPSPVENGCLAARSEEHTSELQSLMRTSYAVFRLTPKNQTPTPP